MGGTVGAVGAPGRLLAALAMGLWLLVGCAERPVQPAPEGVLPILGSHPAMGLGQESRTRKQRGFFGKGLENANMSPIAVDGEAALRLVSPAAPALAGRRVDSPLQVTPFLRWRWRSLAAPEARVVDGEAPVRLLIGFSGGPGPKTRGHGAFPPHDRAVALIWSLDAGADTGTAWGHGPHGHLVVRAGPGDGQWWEHTLDLADLHTRLWPETPPGQVRIRFVAVALPGGQSSMVADVADLALSR